MFTELTLWTRLASRYLWGRKLRTALTIFAIGLAIMLVFGLNGILPAMLTALQQNFLAATGQVDVTISSVSNDTFGTDVLVRVRSTPGVAVVTPSLQRLDLLGRDAPATSVNVAGVDPASFTAVHTIRIDSGRFLAAGDGNAIVLPSTLAQRAKLGVGDTFELPGSTGSTKYRVVGVAAVPGAPGAESVYITLRAAQQLFLQGGKINVIDVKTTPGADKTAVADAIQRKLGTGFKIGGLGSSSQLLASLQLSESAINLFGLFALAMGAFIILNTFRTAVSERRRDIGMLRAIGSSRRTILGMFLAEATLEGVLGTALGLALGYALAWSGLAALNPIVKQYLQFTISGPEFPVATWVVAIAVGLGMTLVGGMWPALQASRLTPIEALRPQAAEVTSAGVGWSTIAGIVTIGVSAVALVSHNVQLASAGVLLFLIGLVMVAPVLVVPAARVLSWAAVLFFPTEGFVAARNAERQPSRAAVTVSVMMIGLSIIVGFVGMIASVNEGFLSYLDKSLGADYLLVPQSIILTGGNAGAGPGLLNSVKAASWVQDATSLRVAQSLVDNTAMQVIGVDPKVYPKVGGLVFSQGDANQAWDALAAGRGIILNGIFAAQHPTQLGDYITLQTAQGERRYKVVGVAVDYLNAKLSTGYISQADLAKDFNETTDLLILANRAPGANATKTKLELRKIVSNYPTFTLYDFADWRTSQLDILQSTIAIYYILAFAIALPSLLALINTLAMAVLERTREIGMMRAVGTTRGQIGTMVLAESLMLSTMGTVLGLIAGVWMSYALVSALSSSGFPLTFYFPWWGLVVALIAGITFGVLAALLPARSAARLKIVDALTYE